MMPVEPLLEAGTIGIAVAAPVGPMSVLCMRRTLAHGWSRGCLTGMGIATGDAIFASIAALGLTGSGFVAAHERPLDAVAGFVLLYLAWTTYAKRASSAAVPVEAPSRFAAYGSALALTLSNAPTIVSFAALLTFLRPGTRFDPAGVASTVLGVFIGSAAWWLVLSASVASVRRAIGARTERWIALATSVTFAAFGLVEISRCLTDR